MAIVAGRAKFGLLRDVMDEHTTRSWAGTEADSIGHGGVAAVARATGLSAMAISRIWRAFALAPHRSETFKLSTDPLFIEKVAR